MNLISNGVSKVLSVERVVSEEILAFKVTFVDYYNRECIRYVTTQKAVDQYVNKKISWTE